MSEILTQVDYLLGEVGAGPELRYPQRDRAHRRGEAEVAVAVADGSRVLAHVVCLGVHYLVQRGFDQGPRQLDDIDGPVLAAVAYSVHGGCFLSWNSFS